MRKAFIIAYKDLYTTFTDRNLILLMFAAPLVLSAIIGVTFGGIAVGGGGGALSDIPVAIVNLDEGVSLSFSGQDSAINYGALIAGVLSGEGVGGAVSGLSRDTADCPAAAAAEGGEGTMTLEQLLAPVMLTSVEEARRRVEADEVAAAVIIPASFSADLQVSPVKPALTPVSIEVYSSPERPISAQIIRGVLDQIGAQFAAGNVTLSALIASLASDPLRISSVFNSSAFNEGIGCVFAGVSSSVVIDRQSISGAEVVINPLVMIGAAQAVFFGLFTANGQASSIIIERKNWTLQRLLITPTPAVIVLFGKMLAVFIVVAVQILFLVVGLTLLASLLGGSPQFIWGTNIPGLLAVIAATALGTAGIGSITAAAAKSAEQAGVIGSIVAIFSAVFGGAFGFMPPPALANLSIVYWGADSFTRLAAGNNDILLNLLVMVLYGAVTFAIGFVLFRSRIGDR
ncbi:MAG: ABC transporter [Chloroflexi bacterium OLB13]|nr:MAG: ABC transporter [Chloroflexi bacterium OLB13]